MNTDAIDHPTWCCRDECSMTSSGPGTHASRPAEVRSDRTGVVALVQVMQGDPVPGYRFTGEPYVVMELRVRFGDLPEEESQIPLAPESAQVLGRLLVGAGREASR